MRAVLKEVWAVFDPVAGGRLVGLHLSAASARAANSTIADELDYVRLPLLTPEMEEVIRDAAYDIECRVNEQYHGPDDVHPAMRRKYDRDIAIVGQLRTIAPGSLRAEGGAVNSFQLTPTTAPGRMRPVWSRGHAALAVHPSTGGAHE
jgi:hypothetical protein